MTVIEKQIEIANAILDTRLVTKVYHSCELVKDNDRRVLFPGYAKGDEYLYAGADDTKQLFAYIRSNGDISSVPLAITSCRRSYNLTIPLRVVFYNDSEDRDFNYLTMKLGAVTFLQNVNLVRVITDKFRLAKEESDISKETFGAKTFYIAYDITANTVLLPDQCDNAACVTHANPICQP